MRPRYMSALNLGDQQYVAGILADHWGVDDLVRLPDNSPLDYAAYRNHALQRYAEIKRRNVDWGTYRDIFLSKYKLDAADTAWKFEHVRSYFVVLFNDRLVETQILNDGRWPVIMGGRYDRNDPLDVELLALVPLAAFTRII